MKKWNAYFKLMLISILAFTVLYSCEGNNVQPTETPPTKSSQISNQIPDTAYLGFEGNLHDPEVIWENMDIYSPAYDRMAKHLKVVDSLLTWDFESAAELNISQNIYDYVTFIWNLDNEKLKSKEYTLKINGIYYGIESKIPGKMLRYPQVLLEGNHRRNLLICSQAIRNGRCYWLGDYIDLTFSPFVSDGYGGYRIWVSGNFGGKRWSYCVSCVAPKENSDQYINHICATDAYELGGDFYEKAMNNQRAPLITVINGDESGFIF